MATTGVAITIHPTPNSITTKWRAGKSQKRGNRRKGSIIRPRAPETEVAPLESTTHPLTRLRKRTTTKLNSGSQIAESPMLITSHTETGARPKREASTGSLIKAQAKLPSPKMEFSKTPARVTTIARKSNCRPNSLIST